MALLPTSLQKKLFFWIIGLCSFFGIITSTWIYYSEEAACIKHSRVELNYIAHRYALNLESFIKTKEALGIQVNRVVLENLSFPPKTTSKSVVKKDKEGALRSSNSLSSAFFSTRFKQTKEVIDLFHSTEWLWDLLAPLVTVDFFNFYMITRDGFIRIHPGDWTLEIKADHDFTKDLFYSVATPEKNPDRLPVWTPVYYDSIWKKWMTSLIIPLYRGDEFLGITGSDFILDDLFKQITSMAELEGGKKGFIVNRNGHLLVHPDHMDLILHRQAQMNSQLEAQNIPDPGLRGFLTDLDKGELTIGTPVTYEEHGVPIFTHSKLIPSMDWIIVVYADWPTLVKELGQLRIRLPIFAFGLAILVAIILVFGFKRIVLARLTALGHTAVAVGKGDLDIHVPVGPMDEVGILAFELDRMRGAVKEKITELAEENLQRRKIEERLAITLDSIGDGVIATDTESRITLMNQVAENLTGWQWADALGKPLLEVFRIVDCETRALRENPIIIALRTETVVTLPTNTVLLSRDGTEYHVSDSGAPIKDDAGEVRGAVLVFRDESEQVQLESQLRQSQKLDSIGKLAGGVAHDFNNMLGGILGYAELLETTLQLEKNRKYAKKITETALRATDLTQKLLDFSRKGKARTTNFDVHSVIKESLGLLQHSIDPMIDISEEFNADYTVMAGDPSQIQNAILNLCMNARDAMPLGGKLKIKTTNTVINEKYCSASSFDIKAGHFIEIIISDTGAGIDPVAMKRIFEPFFTTKEIGRGTGLGLSAVYGSVKDHHGAVNVNSAINQGTQFQLLFPVAPGEVVHLVQDKKAAISGKGCILVIDDEEIILEIAEEILINLGYQAIIASNGKEGVERYRERGTEIDAVILDMVMPVMNGRECFRELKRINPSVAVIIASGYTRDVVIDELFAEGLAGFLTKPFSKVTLSQALHKILA